MASDDVIYQVVPLLITLFVLLVAFHPRRAGLGAGALVEKVLMAFYENTGWVILGCIMDEPSSVDE